MLILNAGGLQIRPSGKKAAKDIYRNYPEILKALGL